MSTATPLPSGRTDVDRRIGRVTRDLLFEKGMTQRALAARLGVDESTVSRLIRGQSHWTAAELYAVADVLGVEPPALLPPVTDQCPESQVIDLAGFRASRAA